MKIYIAASYTRIQEAHSLGKQLEVIGHIVVSQWHKTIQAPDHHSGTRAMLDLEGIETCDLFVEFICDSGSKGGRHCELGVALGLRKHTILIGAEKDECIFTNLPFLRKVDDVIELVEILDKQRKVN